MEGPSYDADLREWTEPFCPYCVCPIQREVEMKRFPLQRPLRSEDLMIPWDIAEAAYKEYRAQYSTQQTLERLAERGGFGCIEIINLLFDRIVRTEGL